MIKSKELLILIFSLIAVCAAAKTFKVGTFEYEIVKKGLYPNEVKLKKDNSSSTDIIIPVTVNYEGTEYTVGKIGNGAFKDNKRVMSVRIPESVYDLEMYAFKNLKTLRKVYAMPITGFSSEKLGKGKSISKKSSISGSSFLFGMGGLAACTARASANLSSIGVNGMNSPALSIGFSTFADCENLDSIDFSQRNTVVMVPTNLYGTKAWGFSYPFQNCKSLRSVVFGNVYFTDVDLKIFKGCHSLTNVVMSTVNPSPYKKLFEDDCPFMTQVYPEISGMSDSEYLAYLESKNISLPSNKPSAKEEKFIATDNNSIETNGIPFRMTEDIMPVPMQRRDKNDKVCALLKVSSPQRNLSFEGNVIGDVEYKNQSQYWVYLTPGSQKVRINAPGKTPVDVEFNDYGTHHVESKRIYEYTHQGELTQAIIINFAPAEATVLIDGVLYDSDNGNVNVDLPLGDHSYIVAARGYVTSEGVVKLRSDGPANINLNLTKSEN